MITLSMIVKNEERYLDDCLKSADGVVDEIVIVDTGSTDGTLKIAEKYNAKIFHFDWINDFAAARNFALENSAGDWILYLDADERLHAKSKDELRKITKDKKKHAYYCRILNIDSVNNRPSIMAYVRLFPNDKLVRFEGAVHEQIEPSLLKNNYQIVNSGIEIDHVGYNISKDNLKVKGERNRDILLKEFQKSGTSYVAFQLGQTFGLLGEKDKAVHYFNLSLKDAKLQKEYKALAYRYIAVCNAEILNWEAAVEQITNSIKCDPDQPLNLMAAAQIFTNMGRYEEAEQLCKKAYQVNQTYNSTSKFSYQSILLDNKTVTRYGMKIAVLKNSSELYSFFMDKAKLRNDRTANEKTDDLKLLETLYDNKLIKNDEVDDYIKCIDDKNFELVLALLDKYNDYDIKINFLSTIANANPGNSTVLNKLGLSLLSVNRFNDAEEVLKKSLEINGNNPSTIFYLASAYLQNNKLDEVKALIKTSEQRYSSFPQIINMLNILKNKLGLA